MPSPLQEALLKQRAVLFIGLIIPLCLYETARAESAQDRVALMLSGPDCPSVRHTITAALQQQAGVLQVDPALMPDHVLIDIVRPSLSEEALATAANAAIGGNQCRAEIMRSCITAQPSGHRPHPPHAADGWPRSH